MTAATDIVEVYKDNGGEWRWRRVAKNGRTIGVSGEGYRTRWGANRAAKRSNDDVEIVIV